MRRQKKTRLRLLTLSVSLLIFAAGAVLFNASVPKLLQDVSTPVPGGVSPWVYAWRNPHELLLFPFNDDRPNPGLPHAAWLDTRRGESSVSAPLDTLCALNSQQWYMSQHISPDGKWLAVSGGTRLNAISLPEGARSAAWQVKGLNEIRAGVAWLPDSVHLLVRAYQGGRQYALTLYNVNAPDEAVALNSFPSEALTLLGVTPNSHIISARYDPNAKDQAIEVFETDLRGQGKALRKTRFTVPRGLSVRDLQLSPQGDRMAWMCYGEERSPVEQLLLRLGLRSPAHTNHNQKGRYTVSLWTARLDGTEMQELGELRNVALAGGDPQNLAPAWLQWTPDGKHLRYARARRLWTVPAP